LIDVNVAIAEPLPTPMARSTTSLQREAKQAIFWPL